MSDETKTLGFDKVDEHTFVHTMQLSPEATIAILAKHQALMPSVSPESLHQATNALLAVCGEFGTDALMDPAFVGGLRVVADVLETLRGELQRGAQMAALLHGREIPQA